jgi:hypothetical protein
VGEGRVEVLADPEDARSVALPLGSTSASRVVDCGPWG